MKHLSEIITGINFMTKAAVIDFPIGRAVLFGNGVHFLGGKVQPTHMHGSLELLVVNETTV